jgi:hypothetical protein
MLWNRIDEIAQGLDDREPNQCLRFLGFIQDGKARSFPTSGCRQSRGKIGNSFETHRPQFGELLSPWFGVGEQRRAGHGA